MSPSLSLAELSAWLCALQAALRERGYAAMYIGGSSARALLDGRVAGLRDVDVFVDGEGREEVGELTAIAEELAAAGTIRAGFAGPRRKLRAQPGTGEAVEIGVGTHVFPRARPLPIVSLTLLRRREALALSGIFDIDAVVLTLATDRPIAAQLDAPVVEDPFDGMAAWRSRRPRVVHWEEVARCHARHGLRVARTLANCGHSAVDPGLAAEYARRRTGLVEEAAEVDRELLKMLAEPGWRAGLRMARELEVFAGVPGYAWLVAALRAWDGGEDESTVLGRARRWLGDAAGEHLTRLAAAMPGVFSFPEV